MLVRFSLEEASWMVVGGGELCVTDGVEAGGPGKALSKGFG